MTKTQRIYQLRVGFLNFVNYVYLIVDNSSQQAAIVDPAWELQKIVDILHEIDVELVAVLLTHSHFDHVNVVKPLLKLKQPQIYMSAEEIKFYKYNCANLNPITDKEIIKVGETEITCLVTPGHTVGSTCFLVPGHLFTGDTIFIEGCGICNTHGGSAEQMFESIRRVKTEVSSETKVYPGHSFGKKPGYTLSHLMQENIYFQLNKKEQFVDFRMRKNQANAFAFK
ncbi:putative polyketide biosynthesis zinc-dependent hydrolase PksB [Candidatus Desulfosporosinus infrequens]|uniref:Putative polyketide biosynthesis zinc-dependent hydrolase PksB n=1 Tax=Candidatus Desulfosporosinus infrequens TaxID=2043169 RepID=A0A2U3L5V8_9FIRM|nr:putative polyketide biosynthesis zinc-dependent hydrolase PksB [Candidatus Desulfosporosinus infrequens]